MASPLLEKTIIGSRLERSRPFIVMKSKILTFFFLAVVAISARATAIDLTGATYTQDFNTLANIAGTIANTTLPTGWALTETGGGARDNEQYAVDNGGSTTGDTYSYGTAGSTDRALGGLRSGTLIPVFGVQFQNKTGGIINQVIISYTGEQWRLGTVGRADQLNFEYSLNATSLDTGTWIGVSALNFISPASGTVGALDGNAAADRTALSTTINPLIVSEAIFWLRWTDSDATSFDDGLAVDDFSLTAYGTPTSVPDSLPAGFAAGAFLLVLGLGYRFGRQTSKA